MSTPRTSEVLNQLMDDKGEIYEGNCPERLVKLARQLETELAAMTEDRDSEQRWAAKYAQERDELLGSLEYLKDQRDMLADWLKIGEDLKAEREKVAKLRKVANHSPSCQFSLAPWKLTCNCGLDEALEATK